MSYTDRSAGRRTASLHCRPPRVIHTPSDDNMATWSTFPATKDVSIGCENRIVDVSGILFCDQTYIGHGSSLDISSDQHIVMSVRGNGGYAISQNAPVIDIQTAPALSTAYATMRLSTEDPEAFYLRAAPSDVSPAASIIINTEEKTNTLAYGAASISLDGSADVVSLTRSEIPVAIAERVLLAPSYRGDYFYEVPVSDPTPLDVSANPILQDGQRMVIVNKESSGQPVTVIGKFYTYDTGSGVTEFSNLIIEPYGSATFRGSLIKQRWVAAHLWGASFSN